MKKAWILCAVWLGYGNQLVDEGLIEIPQYDIWSRKELQREVPLLREDFEGLFSQIVDKPSHVTALKATTWLSGQFDRWQADGAGVFTICIAQEFEREFGRLTIRNSIEVPPYAELLMQGLHSLAVRHPEYMLARDVELLYNLFVDCEMLLHEVDWRSMPPWAGAAGENVQTLGRAVIQACFNLLESYVSGLARGHILENPELPADTKAKLGDQGKSLRQRIVLVPNVIAGRPCGLDVNTLPLSRLFGAIKSSRDSFVHCEPGPEPSPRSGLVKEKLFHEISKALVDETVQLTVDVIRHIWRELQGTSSPRWLPTALTSGRGEPSETTRQELCLRPRNLD